MAKEKWVVKSVRFPESLSHSCMGLKYVARPTNLNVSLLPVSWMTWFSTKALSFVMLDSEALKLVKLKDIAVVNVIGFSIEKKKGDQDEITEDRKLWKKEMFDLEVVHYHDWSFQMRLAKKFLQCRS